MQTANKNKFGRFEAESMIELGKYWLMKGQTDMALVYFSRVEDHIYLAVDFVTKRELFLYTVAAKVSQVSFILDGWNMALWVVLLLENRKKQ